MDNKLYRQIMNCLTFLGGASSGLHISEAQKNNLLQIKQLKCFLQLF